MRRGVASLAEAIAFARALRDQRFHDRDSVFVVDDATGRVVDGLGVPGPEHREGADPPSAETAPSLPFARPAYGGSAASPVEPPPSLVRTMSIAGYQTVRVEPVVERTSGTRVIVVAPSGDRGACQACLAESIRDVALYDDAALVVAVGQALAACRHERRAASAGSLKDGCPTR